MWGVSVHTRCPHAASRSRSAHTCVCVCVCVACGTCVVDVRHLCCGRAHTCVLGTCGTCVLGTLVLSDVLMWYGGRSGYRETRIPCMYACAHCAGMVPNGLMTHATAAAGPHGHMGGPQQQALRPPPPTGAGMPPQPHQPQPPGSGPAAGAPHSGTPPAKRARVAPAALKGELGGGTDRAVRACGGGGGEGGGAGWGTGLQAARGQVACRDTERHVGHQLCTHLAGSGPIDCVAAYHTYWNMRFVLGSWLNPTPVISHHIAPFEFPFPVTLEKLTHRPPAPGVAHVLTSCHHPYSAHVACWPRPRPRATPGRWLGPGPRLPARRAL